MFKLIFNLKMNCETKLNITIDFIFLLKIKKSFYVSGK